MPPDTRNTSATYTPPDLTQIDYKDPRAIDYWSRTLEVEQERLRKAAQKAGPLVENVKKELGTFGVG
jgi:hypothetical protein